MSFEFVHGAIDELAKTNPSMIPFLAQVEADYNRLHELAHEAAVTAQALKNGSPEWRLCGQIEQSALAGASQIISAVINAALARTLPGANLAPAGQPGRKVELLRP